MALIKQVLLPLVAVVLAEAHLIMPFLHNRPGFHNTIGLGSGGPTVNRITPQNAGYNGGYNTWFQHFGNPEAHQVSSESHESDKFYGDYDPFFQVDPYFHQGNWDNMPVLDTVFNIPRPDYNSHGNQVPHRENNPQEKPKEVHNEGLNVQKPEKKPKEIPPFDTKPAKQDKGPKINEDNIPEEKNIISEAGIQDVKNQFNEDKNSDLKNNLNETKIPNEKNDEELLPPKTNEIKKEDDKGDKDDKQVDLDKNKDFLLVGHGSNGNDVYLLHENNPNPTTVVTPNVNQPANNVIYVPYNPGQTNNPVYQFINGQPASQNPTNVHITQDKSEVSNGYQNANTAQPTTNLNTDTQNSGYVTIYSNGQLIQIPGVVVNSAPNNAPIQNGNQIQGMNYIIANAVPNNVPTVPAYQNPGTNVIYATIPNQASNGPIYVPSCMNTMSSCGSGAVVQNSVQGVNNGMPNNNGLPSNVFYYQANPNPAALPVSNGYVQPNMVGDQVQSAITIAIPNQSGQNGQYQQVVQVPVYSGYSQPIVSNLGQGQNQPNPGGMIYNQNIPIQTAVQMPIDGSNNGYNQPIISNQQGQTISKQGEKQQVSYQAPMTNNQNIQFQPAGQIPASGYNQPIVLNQAQGHNAPIQGTTVESQNTQPGVVIPIPSGYGHPLITNPIVNAATRDDTSNNQNVAQPAILVNGDSNLSNQEETNAIVNTPSNTEVINQESDVTQPLATSSIVLDSNNLSSLGAQPAIMISDFKDKSEGGKTDEKKSKDKKENKKDKKPKGDDKPKASELFTNENL